MSATNRKADDLDYCCLDDRPYEGAAAHPRTAALVRLLVEKLGEYVRRDSFQRGDLRIGLYGGYGQGKSGVAQAVENALRQQGIKVARIDISNYLPDELENSFDTILAGLSPLRLALFSGLLAVALAVIFMLWYFPAETGGAAGTTTAGSRTGTGSSFLIYLALGAVSGWALWKPLRLRFRRWIFSPWRLPVVPTLVPASSTRRVWSWEACKDLLSRARLRRALSGFNPPGVLIIDDLDRASVEQQKNVLRSIYRHSRDYRFAVLICMDETALLHSPPTPEEPSELLRKVIHFELRLPHRDQGDFVLMALEACRKARDSNPASTVAAYTQEPEFLCGLIRVLSLLPNASPRRAKRLLNDVLGQAAQLLGSVRKKHEEELAKIKAEKEARKAAESASESDKQSGEGTLIEHESNALESECLMPYLHGADVAALLRLVGLTELAPPCRASPLELAELLEGNRTADWEQYLDRFGKGKEAYREQRDKDSSGHNPSAKPRSGGEITGEDERRRQAVRFFAMTRGLQPASSWRALLATGSVRTTSNAPGDAENFENYWGIADPVADDERKRNYWEFCQRSRRAFNGVAYANRRGGIQDLFPKPQEPFDKGRDVGTGHHVWWTLESLLVCLPLASKRLDLFHYLESQCQGDPDSGFGADSGSLKPALYRAWASDWQVVEGMEDEDLQELADRMKEFPEAVCLLPVEKLGAGTVAEVMSAGGARVASRVERHLRQSQAGDPAATGVESTGP